MNDLLQQIIYYRNITTSHRNKIIDIIRNSKLSADSYNKAVYTMDGKYTFRYNKKQNNLYISGYNFYNLIQF